MPAGAVWEWTEAYGRLEADPAAVQYPDWARAQRDVEERLEALIPAAALEVEHARASEAAGREPAEIVQHGSGWGALEQARHRAAGEPPLAPTSLPFPDETLGVEQTPWLALLRGGALPRPTEDSPGAFMVQREWRDLLEAALRAGRCDHAFAWYHLGVMRHQAGEAEGAREAWRRALAGGPNAWASAALAVLERESGRPDEAAAHALDALRTKPDLAAMAVECGRTLLRAGRPAAWLDALGRLPDAVRRSGRVRTLEAQAALAQGDADRVERILADPAVLVDQREGEKTLVDLWYGLHEERLSRGDGAPKDETMRQRVRRDFPPPATLLLT
jgi:tetratricopeptide (TPR) repeat protein